jgi:thiamine-phosphate pyrophosphorylase
MTRNDASSSTWRLYVIIDPSAAGGRDPVWVAEQAIAGGADALQLRDKHALAGPMIARAQAIRRLTRAAGIPLLINDRVDVAVAAEADGVHLGQDDLPVHVARRLLGPDRLIGKSTHSLEQALAGAAEPVDYIAVGPIFATPTKPDYAHVGLHLVQQVTARVRTPVVCIGGIDASTVGAVREAGARCVVVVRAVCAAADPAAAARELKRAMLTNDAGEGQTSPRVSV